MEIIKPIIIVGSGRSGTTVFHRLLARHPGVTWLSGICDRFPTVPALNRWAVAAVENPVIRRMLGDKLQAGECYDFWDYHAFCFSLPFRDLLADDVTPRIEQRVRAALEPMLTRKRNRLLIKVAGWPRIGFLNEIFPDARFIHIARDGRAVASSLVHVNFWPGWRGPQGWGAGPLSAEDQAAWEETGFSFVALAGLQWLIRERAIETARQAIEPGRFHDVRYETFCQQPMDTFREVLEFAELPASKEFERQVKATPIKDSNRWRQDLTLRQQKILNYVLGDELIRQGYEVVDRLNPVTQIPV